MVVGIDFEELYLDPDSDFGRYRVATGWNPVPPGGAALDLRSFLVSLKRDADPHGHKFHYVSPNSDLLGWVLERAADTPYAALVSEALWRPMGAERSEEHTSELQSLMRISYAVFCLKKKK